VEIDSKDKLDHLKKVRLGTAAIKTICALDKAPQCTHLAIKNWEKGTDWSQVCQALPQKLERLEMEDIPGGQRGGQEWKRLDRLRHLVLNDPTEGCFEAIAHLLALEKLVIKEGSCLTSQAFAYLKDPTHLRVLIIEKFSECQLTADELDTLFNLYWFYADREKDPVERGDQPGDERDNKAREALAKAKTVKLKLKGV
jgi:hypothetical protein